MRYDPVAVTLHWLMALLILAMIPLGFFMGDLPESVRYDTYAIHKSTGLVVLALSLVRLYWRLKNPPPPLPETMQTSERLIARASHWLFYVAMIGMPLTGWLMVSASQKYPTVFYWTVTVPFLPLPEGIDPKASARMFHDYHEWFAYGALLLIVLHVSAALRHHFIRRDTVLVRMLPRFLGGR